MKSLAELKKRIKIGTRILKTRGCSDKGVNTIRIVDKVQTNSFSMNGCWLDYPKATLIEFDTENKNMFRIYKPKQNEGVFVTFNEKEKGELVGEYEILDDILVEVELYADELISFLAKNKVYNVSYDSVKVNQLIYLHEEDKYLRIDGISYGNPNLFTCSIICKD